MLPTFLSIYDIELDKTSGYLQDCFLCDLIVFFIFVVVSALVVVIIFFLENYDHLIKL